MQREGRAVPDTVLAVAVEEEAVAARMAIVNVLDIEDRRPVGEGCDRLARAGGEQRKSSQSKQSAHERCSVQPRDRNVIGWF